MKKRAKIALDVDYLGGQSSLTQEEEKAISNFIKKNKSKKAKFHTINTKVTKQLI